MWYDSIGFTNILLVLIIVLNSAILLEIWRIKRDQK